MTEYLDRLPENIPGGMEGVMAVAVKTEKGFTVTRDYGFTIEEENGQVLAFDMFDHPELGITILFGNQVFALKYWDEEDLHKGLQNISNAVELELQRRKDAASKAVE